MVFGHGHLDVFVVGLDGRGGGRGGGGGGCSYGQGLYLGLARVHDASPQLFVDAAGAISSVPVDAFARAALWAELLRQDCEWWHKVLENPVAGGWRGRQRLSQQQGHRGHGRVVSYAARRNADRHRIWRLPLYGLVLEGSTVGWRRWWCGCVWAVACVARIYSGWWLVGENGRGCGRVDVWACG